MSDDTSPCPVCGTAGVVAKASADAISYDCRRCGKFELTGTARAMITAMKPEGRIAANASGWIRENQGASLSSRDLGRLLSLPTPTVAERALKVLRELERRQPAPGSSYSFEFSPHSKTSGEWLAISWSEFDSEVQYLLHDYLRDEVHAIDATIKNVPNRVTYVHAKISPKGFRLLEEERQGNIESAIGFCAMWFSAEVQLLWTEAIEPAIARAGYEPKRIDTHEHTNRIDDEIIAMIRRSRFVVADFTGQRGGVYFEAGYALGQGRRVIWTCREDALSEVHFDTRQYNFLVWNPADYAGLARRLQNRIEATLGRGPR
jgi:hypothetical protein